MISEEQPISKFRRNWWRTLTPAVISMALCVADVFGIVYRLHSSMGYSLLLMPVYAVAFLFLLVLDLAAKFTILSVKRIWYFQLAVILPAFLLMFHFLHFFPGWLLVSILRD